MVSCKHCATPNSIDSTFCKKCGTPLPDEDLKLAAEKLEVVIAEGVSLFNGGHFDEAMDVAETATTSNPSSVAALALKGDCHAHRGEIAEAIECYERIVSINPESTLDKLRLNQLRNSLVLGAQTNQPDRRIALIGAIAAVVLVISVTAMIARSRADSAPQSNLVATAKEPADRAQFWQPQPQPQTQPTTQQPTEQTAEPNVQRPQPQTQPEAKLPPPSASNELPRPYGRIDSNEATVVPFKPNIPEGTIKPNPPKSNDDPSTEAPTTANPPQLAPEDPGQIEIRVQRGNQPLPGGSTSVTNSSMGADVLMRVARQQYQLGNYSGAAGAYEKALAGGGDPISINQRLGQAYERLGRVSDASSAYQRAITAADSAISSGKGNKDRLQAIQDSCRQALRVLQGT